MWQVMEHLDREEVEKVGRACWAVLFHEIWIVTTPNMEHNPILRHLQWDPATGSSCRMGIPSRDSEAHMPQYKDNPAKQQVPDPSKSRANEHRFGCTWAEF